MREDQQPLGSTGQPGGTLQRIIGITGGLAMGKTTISNYLFTTYYVPVLDADLYARDAVVAGSEVLQEIVERYGASILLPDDTLDRTRLGEIVFSSPPERLWLEQRIHPYVRDRIQVELKTLAYSSHATVVLVIPLLFEARMTDLVNEIWVVTCPVPQQIERLIQRDRLDMQQVQARLSSQMAIEQKIRRADVVLDNSTTPEELLRQVDAAFHRAIPLMQQPP